MNSIDVGGNQGRGNPGLVACSRCRGALGPGGCARCAGRDLRQASATASLADYYAMVDDHARRFSLSPGTAEYLRGSYRKLASVEGTLDEPIPHYPLLGWLSVVIIAGCMLAIAAAVKGWL